MRKPTGSKVALVLCYFLVVVAFAGWRAFSPTWLSSSQQSAHQNPRSLKNEQESVLLRLQQKMQPRYLLNTTLANGSIALMDHQFLHHHHMKTGGTSVDQLLKCAWNRLRQDFDVLSTPYYVLHSCHERKFKKCVAGEDYQSCRTRIDASAFLSYCAPLNALPSLPFDPPNNGAFLEYPGGALTILRHPVDRVWSMYRYEPLDCYQCVPLKEVYESMASNTVHPYISKHCLGQLQNRMVYRLQSPDFPANATDEERVQDALHNLKTHFQVVGLTEHMNETIQMIGHVFPWLRQRMPNSNLECPLPHANPSSDSNFCGPNYTSRPIDKHPDEATRKLIEEYNQLDLRLYEAAVEYFELEKQALGIGQGI